MLPRRLPDCHLAIRKRLSRRLRTFTWKLHARLKRRVPVNRSRPMPIFLTSRMESRAWHSSQQKLKAQRTAPFGRNLRRSEALGVRRSEGGSKRDNGYWAGGKGAKRRKDCIPWAFRHW